MGQTWLTDMTYWGHISSVTSVNLHIGIVLIISF